jgi:hypothetical protein
VDFAVPWRLASSAPKFIRRFEGDTQPGATARDQTCAVSVPNGFRVGVFGLVSQREEINRARSLALSLQSLARITGARPPRSEVSDTDRGAVFEVENDGGAIGIVSL